ncbi:MAG: S8 family serine peptidase [Nitrospinae bacterium]|nr:S8 family serine peptidase [Nitrospinota bacterium]
MSRFLMTNRRAGKFSNSEKLKSRKALLETMDSSFISNVDKIIESKPKRDTARAVVYFEAEDEFINQKKDSIDRDVIIEPEIFHYNSSIRPAELVQLPRSSLSDDVNFGNTINFNLTIQGAGNPLYGCEVILHLRTGGINRSTSRVTNRNGRVRFTFSDSFSISTIVVVPAAGFWPMMFRGLRSGNIVECPPLPSAKSRCGWWHNHLGIQRFKKTRGRGIKVGVADTGVGPHAELVHVIDIGAFVDGLEQQAAGADIDVHGSHVCGTIGARPTSSDHFGGIAAGVRLFSTRVFQPASGANQGDIANAIDALSREHKVDLINLSLGASVGSQIIRDAIIDAAERGTLCVCAAANSNGAVEYPAAFPETLAISALGLEGWGPPGSIAAQRLPIELERFGQNNLYHANFSCFGPEINGTAPGVGIISTVPERLDLEVPYASMGGTSMATPAACAALAAVLAADQQYRALPRSDVRTEHAKLLFQQSCNDIGLHQQYQGYGMPQVP